MILVSQGENAASVMEGDVSCGWGLASESRAAGPEPDCPPAAQKGSGTAVCSVQKRSPGERTESRGGMKLKGTLPYPTLFALPGRLSPLVQSQRLLLCEAPSQNPGRLEVSTASMGGINPSEGNQS